MLTACGHVTAFAHSETNLSWRPRYFVRQRSSTLAGHQCVAADRVLCETVSLALFWLRGIIRGPTVI
jgi:predicted PhzF superfamily epimerase YddE/YHI9